MAKFVPFRAYRPLKEFVDKVASKPYDVLNREEALEECKDNPLSYYHVIKPEIEFAPDHNPFDEKIYSTGRDNLNKLIDQKVMVQDARESFYIYELTMGDHTQTGIVGCCSIDDYFNKVIKKHELTKPKIEEDRTKHVVVSKFNYEPVFFSYIAVEAIDKVVEASKQAHPEYDFTTDDGIHHILWKVDDESTISQISDLFENEVEAIYIADGHHRTAAGANGGKILRDQSGSNGDMSKRHNYLMSVVFPDNQMKILDYNRVVKDLHGLSSDQFLSHLESNFVLEPKGTAYRPLAHEEIGMYLDGKWYCLKAKEGSYNGSDEIEKLGFSILSKNILEPILNIHDLRRDKRIAFVGGIRGLEELERRVNSGEMQVAFAVHPISMDTLMYVSDNDMIMPPKVTWFEPKLRSGLFAHSLKD